MPELLSLKVLDTRRGYVRREADTSGEPAQSTMPLLLSTLKGWESCYGADELLTIKR